MTNDLVSIVILTYNSAEFIIETLESAKNQTYSNIELIISDDASVDNTIAICEEWIKTNSGRFVNVQLLKVPVNTGISPNYNRALKAVHGKWVKYCSGDDALLPNCLEDNLNYVSKNPGVKVLFSYCRMYNENLNEECFSKLSPSSNPSGIITSYITALDQYKLLLVSNRIPFTPSAFIHYETHLQYGIIDEKLAFSEDYQLWLSFTKNGCKLFFMEKETMKYRIHEKSVSKQLKKCIVNPIYFKTEHTIKVLSYPFIPWDLRYSKKHYWYVNHLFKIEFLNRKTKFNTSLYYILSTLLNPFQYIIYYKTHYSKTYKNNIFYKK